MKSLVLLGILMTSPTVFAEDCAQIAYSHCDGIDTLQGGRRHEFRVKKCQIFEEQVYQTDYRCTTPGKLLRTTSRAIENEWNEKQTTYPESEDAFEFGDVYEKNRISWNEKRTSLIVENLVKKNVKIRNLSSRGDKFIPWERETYVKKTITSEADAVVIRMTLEGKRKGPKTRNEWLREVEESITDFSKI